MDIKPIETIYNGYRFRSRLEARWAVFFDTLCVAYEYEPQGFELPNGDRYLPDFRIKCYGTRGCFDADNPFDLYIEVKGNATDYDIKRIHEFSKRDEYVHDFDYIKGLPILVVGDIPNFEYGYAAQPDDLGCYCPIAFSTDGEALYQWNYETIDGDLYGAYPAVKNGMFYLDGDDCHYTTTDVDVIDNAFRIARQARFEHGETPQTRKEG